MGEVGPDFWATADQIDASLSDTKAILERWRSEPSPEVELFRKLRADLTALEERVTKLESEKG